MRARRKEQEEKNKGRLQSEINEVLKACVERINLLQREDLDLYERRKLAIDFKEFVDKYVNPEYRENFYQFINHILHKYRMEAHYNADVHNNIDKEDDLAASHIEWPLNCTHIKIAYDIWNSRKSQFRNPLEIAQKLKQYYYEESAHNENEYEQANSTYITNYLGGNHHLHNEMYGQEYLDMKRRFDNQFQTKTEPINYDPNLEALRQATFRNNGEAIEEHMFGHFNNKTAI